MNRLISIVLLVSVLLTGQLFAQQQMSAEDNTGYVILDTFTLLFFLIGVFFAAQLYIYMKGGALMSTWRWLTGAILLLAILKILEIAQAANLLIVEPWLIKSIYLIAAIFLASGFYGQKKALS